MAKKTADKTPRKTKCFGLVANYYNGGAGDRYAQPGQGPHVIFDKTWDQLSLKQKSYIKDGDTVIEFEEVARYTIKNVTPSLEPLGGSKSE